MQDTDTQDVPETGRATAGAAPATAPETAPGARPEAEPSAGPEAAPGTGPDAKPSAGPSVAPEARREARALARRIPPVSAGRLAAPGGHPPDASGRSLRPLAAVAVAFVLLQLALVVPGSALSWDETVYTSQVGRDSPAAFFSAPRARGVSFLAAPVAALTPSVTALRCWLALLSGAGLLASLAAWRGLLPTRQLAVAGGLFASLWMTLFYGPAVMPNLWTAFGALAAVGCFLRATGADGSPGAPRRSARGPLTGLVLSVAAVALLRPPDALWLTAALAAAALAVRRWRRPALLGCLGGAAVLGAAPWAAEAYLRYGGLLQRLHRASEIQGGMSPHLAVDDQIRSLQGWTLCRPCDVPWTHPATALWWLALPPLVAAGLVAASRRRRTATALLPALTAAVMAVPYLFLIDYAAPRFLLPSYALLALPVAESLSGVYRAARAPRSWPRLHPRPRFSRRARVTVPAALVTLALAGHLAVQLAILVNKAAESRSSRAALTGAATRLHTAGVRPPCVLSGEDAIPLAFYTGCASRQTGGPDASTTPSALRASARTTPVAILVPPDTPRPPHTAGWPPTPLPADGRFTGYRAYVSPSAR